MCVSHSFDVDVAQKVLEKPGTETPKQTLGPQSELSGQKDYDTVSLALHKKIDIAETI